MAYSSNVERWRSAVERIFREVGGDKFHIGDVDKGLYVIDIETGGTGDPTIYGDGGHAVGLFQNNNAGGLASGRSLVALEDPEANIRLAAEAIYGAQGWRPWGEGVLYQGKPFGALGNRPYPGTESSGSSEAMATPPFRPEDFKRSVGRDPDTGADIFATDHAAYWAAYNQWQAAQRWEREDSAQYYEALINEVGAQVDAGTLNLAQAQGEFTRRFQALQEGNKMFSDLLGYALPNGATRIPGAEFYSDLGASGEMMPSPTHFNPFDMAMDIVNQTPNLWGLDNPNPGQIAGMSSMLEPGRGINSVDNPSLFDEALDGNINVGDAAGAFPFLGASRPMSAGSLVGSRFGGTGGFVGSRFNNNNSPAGSFIGDMFSRLPGGPNGWQMLNRAMPAPIANPVTNALFERLGLR